MRSRYLAALVALLAVLAAPGRAQDLSMLPGAIQDLAIAPRAPFVVQFGDLSTSYRVLGMYVLPGQSVALSAWPLTVSNEYLISAAGGTLARLDANRWTWTAPETTGLYPIEIRPANALTSIRLNAFVMVPLKALHRGKVNGYTIGNYPSARASAKHAGQYQPPKGFIEVTRATENAQVSPHFRLGQFVTKQGGAYPRYLVLREPLLMKLEAILEESNRRGLVAKTFTIMSGYRTPAYNAGLGNVQLSRHQFGDASDIFVDDHPADGVMDDLNHDGRIDVGDALRLSQVADWVSLRPGNEALVGGLGIYTRTTAHGPFVHVDVRGFQAHWSGEGVAYDAHPPEDVPPSGPAASPGTASPRPPAAIGLAMPRDNAFPQ